ncbi:MAG: hypothetical protein AABZ39_13465 [Spirochaetota bacterium]
MFYRLVLALSVLIAAVSCSVFQPPTVPFSSSAVPMFFFTPTNSIFWYQPIPAVTNIDANSAVMIADMVRNRPQGTPTANPHTAVCYADASTARYNVPVNAVYPPNTGIRNVPIPAYMLPHNESDSHVAIIDAAGGYSYEFWQMRILNGRWVAGNAAIFSLAGNGVNPFISARASGFSLLAGLIWPQELFATNIRHALVISWANTKKGGPVAPATYSDGRSDETGAIPMGALIRLKPAFVITSLSNTDMYQRAIMAALQTYGGYVCDSGGFSIYCVSPQSYSSNPYVDVPSYNKEFNTIDLSMLPIDQLEVIHMGPVLATSNGYTYPGMYY